MKTFKPVISTAKVRGLIKKNNIRYVNATGSLSSSIRSGIHVWQLCDSVYFKVYGMNDEHYDKYLTKFAEVLNTVGLTYKGPSQTGTYEIVKVVA